MGEEIHALSRKLYLEVQAPKEGDSRSYRKRIEEAVCRASGGTIGRIRFSLDVLRGLYPLCDSAAWRVTASLAWDGEGWLLVRLEPGDTSGAHYGFCADLGSTTAVLELTDCGSGRALGRVSVNNRQIARGADILTRIFYCKDHPQRLEELRRMTVETLLEAMERLEEQCGVRKEECINLTVSGNAAMIHFLYGLDPFCVFSAPYALRADAPDIYGAKELGFPLKGMVYSYPARANYLGGDIVSGIAALGLDETEELSVFLDIGTNGELVVGNRDFLLCGAGAAGPALEGGVIRTGMRAEPGAVSYVRIGNGKIECEVIGGEKPSGICGSGIVDLLAEMFLNGWLDIRGKFNEQASTHIRRWGENQELGVEYAPGLVMLQSDIDEFILTKAAAHTMVSYMLGLTGITMDQVERFYVAGAFGTYLRKESAVAIGLYPDIDRERICSAGNTSLEGARKLLLDRGMLARARRIVQKMEYIQFGAVEDFLHMMVAAQALPHTDLDQYPTVKAELIRRGTWKE